MPKYGTEVQDLGLYDAATYLFQIIGGTKSETGKPLSIQIKFEFKGAPEERKQYIGGKYTERFFLGTDDDPDAELPATRSSGGTGIAWSRWKSLAKAAGVFCKDSDEEFDALVASKSEVVGDLAKRGYEDKVTHEFKGPFNNIARYYEPGKRELRMQPDPTTSGQAQRGKPSSGDSGTTQLKTCPTCDHTVPERLFEQHRKRHEVDGEEE